MFARRLSGLQLYPRVRMSIARRTTFTANLHCLSPPHLFQVPQHRSKIHPQTLSSVRSMYIVHRESELDETTESISLPELQKDVSWGFVLYRCTYKDDNAWHRMIQFINDEVKGYLTSEDRMDLLPRHQLVIMDDQTKFDGATSHEIRNHFSSWVADELTRVLVQPEEFLKDPDKLENASLFLGTRYDFCLFVDDICLESFDHMTWPVLKLLFRGWGNLEPHEQNYIVHPDWEDGQTDDGDEDVGWMYISGSRYVEFYNTFNIWDWWYDEYARPPAMIGEEEENYPGFWRRKS